MFPSHDLVGGNSVLVGGSNNSVGHNNSVVLGGSSLTTTMDNQVVVPNLTATSITASVLQSDNATFTSASIGYLQTITGSATIIGDAYVIVNSSPTSRYAGIKVYESGAAVPTTASLEFDSQTND